MNLEKISLYHSNCSCVLLHVFLSGSDEGTWYLDLKNGRGAIGSGEPAGGADCVMKMDGALFTDMFVGKASPTTSFMMGKLKIKGDMALAMKLEKLMQQTQKSKL